MTNTDTNAFIEIVRQQLTNAPEGVDTSALAAAIDALANPEEHRVKIWFLLDRSGSMQHLAGDVIGGFNQFLADQATKPGKVRMTAVQFDGQDPFEIIYDAQHVAAIPPLTNTTYWARGVTPLYDAVGTLIERADARLVKRAKDGCPLEDQLVLVFTDGLENASHRFERAQVFDMIKNRMDNDWTFVFMGANQDSYAEGGKIERAMVVLDKPIKTLGMHEVKVRLHAEVVVTVTMNIARSQDEADRQARGENIITSQFEEERAAAEEAAADLLEGGAGQIEGDYVES